MRPLLHVRFPDIECQLIALFCGRVAFHCSDMRMFLYIEVGVAVERLHAQLSAKLATWRKRARTRIALTDLDARELADIGVTESARQRECAKWFWEH